MQAIECSYCSALTYWPCPMRSQEEITTFCIYIKSIDFRRFFALIFKKFCWLHEVYFSFPIFFQYLATPKTLDYKFLPRSIMFSFLYIHIHNLQQTYTFKVFCQEHYFLVILLYRHFLLTLYNGVDVRKNYFSLQYSAGII